MKSTKATYEKMQKYAKRNIPTRYNLRYAEIEALLAESSNACDVICLAFRFGFGKGCRYTRKAVTVNV